MFIFTYALLFWVDKKKVCMFLGVDGL